MMYYTKPRAERTTLVYSRAWMNAYKLATLSMDESPNKYCKKPSIWVRVWQLPIPSSHQPSNFYFDYARSANMDALKNLRCLSQPWKWGGCSGSSSNSTYLSSYLGIVELTQSPVVIQECPELKLCCPFTWKKSQRNRIIFGILPFNVRFPQCDFSFEGPNPLWLFQH